MAEPGEPLPLVRRDTVETTRPPDRAGRSPPDRPRRHPPGRPSHPRAPRPHRADQRDRSSSPRRSSRRSPSAASPAPLTSRSSPTSTATWSSTPGPAARCRSPSSRPTPSTCRSAEVTGEDRPPGAQRPPLERLPQPRHPRRRIGHRARSGHRRRRPRRARASRASRPTRTRSRRPGRSTLLDRVASADDLVRYAGVQFVSAWSAGPAPTARSSRSRTCLARAPRSAYAAAVTARRRRCSAPLRATSASQLGGGPVELLARNYSISTAGQRQGDRPQDPGARDRPATAASSRPGSGSTTAAACCCAARCTTPPAVRSGPARSSRCGSVPRSRPAICRRRCPRHRPRCSARSEVADLRESGCSCPALLVDSLALYQVRRVSTSTGTVLHLSYSDGLSTVSLFEQPGRVDETVDGRLHAAGRRRRRPVRPRRRAAAGRVVRRRRRVRRRRGRARSRWSNEVVAGAAAPGRRSPTASPAGSVAASPGWVRGSTRSPEILGLRHARAPIRARRRTPNDHRTGRLVGIDRLSRGDPPR